MARPSIPPTPRVISPSPSLSEPESSRDNYFRPVTHLTRKRAVSNANVSALDEIDEDPENAELRRARSKSRSPMRHNKLASLTSRKALTQVATQHTYDSEDRSTSEKVVTDGHLAPTRAFPGWSWRDLSRSPSPLGLIPIHRQWRIFVHKHEVPRKILHVSIGFFTLYLYTRGTQTTSITPYLLGALIPIATVDHLRHNYTYLNRVYVRLLGALMRESEYQGWNGVIWYLLGVWCVLRVFPKDIGLMGILLLSWCDTAASTFGRAYGKYTPRIRKGKSLAGSAAAFLVGIGTAAAFWGWLAPRTGPFRDDIDFPFMFTGVLHIPSAIRDMFGLTEANGSIDGALALSIISVWTGFVASASEVVNLFGWDDNLTIPVLSGIGIWAFLKVFA